MNLRYSTYTFIAGLMVLSGLVLFPEKTSAQVYAEPGFMKFDDTLAFPDFVDGPHVQWTKTRKFEAVFSVYDSASEAVMASFIPYRLKEGGKYIRGYNFGPKDYWVQTEHPYPPGMIETESDIMVVGDVHGEYESLVKFLKKSGVINASLDWKWGERHLVFLGDLMDRGDKVTETLWFVKKLQNQAARAGGGVHLLLGNHEIMNLTGDHRYLNKKYRILCEKLEIDYFKFFTASMELGRWLRSRNTMLRINDHLFVHGGISPELAEKKIPIDSLNMLMHQFLKAEITSENFDVLFFLTDNTGPFWYRGLLYGTTEYPRITEMELNNILDFYSVNHIIIGHSEHKYFQIRPDRKVFGIDVPFRYSGKTEQGLLFRGEEIYKVYSDGSLVKVP